MKKFILSLLAILAVAIGSKAADVTDVLDNAWTGISGTNYVEKTGLSASSDAVYSVQCAGGNSAIQLRSNNNNSGVVTTKSGGIAKEIKVSWNGNTNSARILQVYGSHSAFSSPSDLYNNSDITLIGEIDVNTSTLDLDADNEFEYIGFRSKSGALYLDEVDIIWTTTGGSSIAKPTLPASKTFVESMDVEITSDYTVYYTTDGNDPKASDALYVEPFEITETTTVKAVAYDATTGQFSSVAEATYTKMEMMTIAGAQAADAGTDVYVEGVVVAAGDPGCLITDNTDFIYYYAGSGNTFTPGMKVRGIGKTSDYGGAKQLPAGSLTQIGEEDYNEKNTPLEVTGEMLDQYVADAVTPRCYATVRGTLSISGNYYNIAVDGATEGVASIIKPMPEHVDFAAQMNGKDVIVTGYLMYVKSKYVYFVATEMQAIELETLDNASFDENPQYTVDATGNLGTTGDANCATIPGWELVGSAAWCSSAEFEYGTTATLNGKAVPAAGPAGSASTGALGLTVGWSGTIDYTQACFMPAGYYKLTYWAYNANDEATQFKSNIGFEVNGGKVTSTLEAFPTGEWIQDEVLIKIENDVEAFIHVGGSAISGGSGANAKLFIDDVEIVTLTEEEYNAALLASVKEAALAELDNYVEGDGLFYWSRVTEAKDAVAAATTEDEITQALALPTYNKPVEGTAYAVKLANTDVNLSVAHEAITVENNSAVYFTEVEGGWAISGNIEGSAEYIYYPGNNLWTLSSIGDIQSAYVMTVNPVDAGYTIQGTNGRLLGVDSQDPGSKVWADKGPLNKTPGQYVWTIEEWTEPAGPEDMTDLIKNPAYLENGYENWTYSSNGFKARTYESPMNLITYSGNCEFEVSQTLENVPAGLYKLGVHAFYRAGEISDEQSKIDAGTELEKELTMYAQVGEDKYSQKVMNLSEGGDATQHDTSDATMTVGGSTVYVPANAAASRQWYIDGKYLNEVLFNVFEDGAVTIGLSKTVGLPSDYCPIGSWTLTRLGDADADAAKPDDNGEEPPTPIAELEPGKYYVRNAATGQYFGPGNNWGTHASVIDEQVYNTFAKLADGTYTMETMVSNGGTSYYNSGEWMDGAAAHFTITQVEDGLWTIALDGKYYVATDNTVLAPTAISDVETNQKAWWKFLTQEEIDAENASALSSATADNPVDATFLVIDAGFGRNRRDASSVWNPTGANITLGGPNDDVVNYVLESYRSSNGFSIKQTINNAPKGVYKLNVQGFYRQDGSDNDNLPIIFMNDKTVQIPLLSGTENSMKLAGQAFKDGKYAIDPIFVQLDDEGTIELGSRLENNNMLWVCMDNFHLTYYGPDADLLDVMLGDLVSELAEQRTKAAEYASNTNLHSSLIAALTNALSDTENVEATEQAYKDAIAELKTVNEKAENMLKAKEALDAMKQLTENTNFYTEEAYETYYGQWQTKYDEGTLTDEEASGLQNPYKTTGWHDAITVDNLLLSVWDADPDIFSGYYINSWSVEGENDGTNFIVPFFEYWTDSANTLAKKTLTAKIENLPSGEYNVTAWVRVQTTNGAAVAPYGISMKVNDGDAVDVCTGASVDGTQFYIGEFTATGTVVDDGILNLSFNVDDTNVSWLSFQNVKYEQLPPPTIVVDGADVPVIGTVDVEASVEEKMPYTGDTATFNTDDVLAFFGGETTMSDLTVYWLNPDGATVTPAYGDGTIDGWRNAEGFAAMWGDSANGMCVKLQDPASGIFDYIGAHDGNFLAGDTYVAKYAFVKDGQAVVVALNVNFYAPAPVEAEVVKTIVINHDEIEKISYSGNTETGDAAAICEALGVESLSDVIYKVAFPAGEGYVYEAVNTDGWRDATTGEQKSWGSAEGLICVKVWDEATSEASADLTYIGCIDDTHVAGEICTFYYAFIANNKAVIYQININFVSDTTGINAIAADALLKGNVFDLSGRKVGTIQKGQIYIVNGKKIMVK